MISFYFTYDNIWMMFPRLFICSSVALKDILYLLNCKTHISSNLYCTGQRVDNKVISISVVLWRRANKKEGPVPILSTIISSHLSLEISVVDMSKEPVSMWQNEGAWKWAGHWNPLASWPYTVCPSLEVQSFSQPLLWCSGGNKRTKA